MSITFSAIHFAYKKGSPIFKDFSMEVKQGDVIALKGESGSGKTTFFRLLLGFETPDHGEIRFNANKLIGKRIKEIRRQTAYLPQELDLGEGRVNDVFRYPFSFKANKDEKPERETVFSTFGKLGLSEGIWDEKTTALSTGQRQRVGMALCHLLGKKILLLDEPTSALDEAAKEKAAELLFDGKRTILSASHDPWWLERCDKIVELKPH